MHCEKILCPKYLGFGVIGNVLQAQAKQIWDNLFYLRIALYTQEKLEKSEILENTSSYKNTEVAELFCVVYNAAINVNPVGRGGGGAGVRAIGGDLTANPSPQWEV